MVIVARYALPAYAEFLFVFQILKLEVFIMLVYVLNANRKPLMPCLPVIARLLLKQNKAKCINRTPFTIKLTYQPKEYIQKLTLGVDTGSSKIGSAVVNTKSQVIYMSEIKIRNNIADRLKQRSKYRRNRRFRKTRYRKARWLNRKNSINKKRDYKSLFFYSK